MEARHPRCPKATWTVSPSELREALSGLGKAAIKFELSEMHDAAEVSVARVRVTIIPMQACCRSISPHLLSAKDQASVLSLQVRFLLVHTLAMLSGKPSSADSHQSWVISIPL